MTIQAKVFKHIKEQVREAVATSRKVKVRWDGPQRVWIVTIV